MVNNIQPRLSKIGKSLSFQNNKSISSDANGFALTNNDGTAANLNTGDLNSVSINASGNLKVEGRKTELDTDLVTAKDNKIFLNSKSEKELHGGGIYLGEGIGTLAFTITGLDTDTVSVHYEKSFLCSGVNITANGNLYGFDIDDCSSFFMIADGLQSNQEFTNNFEVIASGTDLIISAKTGTINVVSFLGVHNKKIEYNNGWQFNDGVTVDTHTITDSTLRVIGTESVILDTPTLLANDSYVPDQNKSLITKDYADEVTGKWTSYIKLLSTKMSLTFPEVTCNNNSLVMPAIYGLSNQMELLTLYSGDTKLLRIVIDKSSVQIYCGEDYYNVSYPGSGTFILFFGNTISLNLNNSTLIEIPNSISNSMVNNMDLFRSDGQHFTAYCTNNLTWYNYILSEEDIEKLSKLRSIADNNNCYFNLLFSRKYSDTKIPDTRQQASLLIYSGSIEADMVNMDQITME